jgi:hypothetical protein
VAAAGVGDGLVQGAVLLGLLAIGCERLREGVSWGGWVRLGSVVDLCQLLEAIEKADEGQRTGGGGALSQEADHGLALLEEDSGSVHVDGEWSSGFGGRGSDLRG